MSPQHAAAPSGSDDRFPAPVYARTVLAPAFAHTQAHHLGHLMRLHRAHAVMLAEEGLMSRADAAAILGALDAVERERADATEPAAFTGEHEDLFFFIESRLARHVDPDIAGRLHTGRSRNDIDHTLFKMALRERLDALASTLLDVVEVLIRRATADIGTIVLAYTHGQPAQPTTFGHYLSAMTEALLRDFDRLMQARDVVDRCTMGAAAITTTGFALNRERMADLLGFSAILRNSYGCIASSDYTAGTYAALKLNALNVGRFAQDMGFWAAFEVGQLRLSDGFVQISSIMPQKRNPVPIEHMRLMASLCAGQCDAVMLALHNTPFTDMNDNEHEVHGQGYAAFATADRLLSLLAAVIASAEVNETRARANIDASYATITELADTLVREEGVAFSGAHHVAAALARAMQATGQTLSTVPYGVFADLFAARFGRRPGLDEPTFRRVTTPDHFVAVRNRPGGPAREAMTESLALYCAQARAARAALAAHRERDVAARKRHGAAIAAIVHAGGSGKGA
ncbi:argininosuccinate lyase [Limobrevibacterium gyesilva]|uniref:Argininosuccinate lyase n=1 Tax=Limobrevibacterium gyesilva TaxID=2991712 RepID=A0AA42CHI0_9PROT|nr:argininosuccinate lyase [Limobrevibacterium gyesilva]MCW3475007.1 argininosuccinate lyase [Limobrevibacterium gyesilva]